jgi:hypothetical protein
LLTGDDRLCDIGEFRIGRLCGTMVYRCWPGERLLGTGSEQGPGEMLASEMLPGERLLWAGRPARARVSVADAGFSAFLLAALAVAAVFGTAQLRSSPRFFRASTCQRLPWYG